MNIHFTITLSVCALSIKLNIIIIINFYCTEIRVLHIGCYHIAPSFLFALAISNIAYMYI